MRRKQGRHACALRFSRVPRATHFPITHDNLCCACAIHELKMEVAKVARNAFDIGAAWNLEGCHSNKSVKLILWSTFSRILLQRIKHFWYKLAEISFFIIFDQNSVECKAWSLDVFAYFGNLNISGTKRDIWKIINSTFLLTQTTCLCFKLISIGKMRFSS